MAIPRRLGLLCAVTALATVWFGCWKATRLDNVVLAYDETTVDTTSKLLLLNIARAHQNLPIHFTGVSSILATYRVTFSAGLGPPMTGEIGWLPVPQINVGTEESPTVSITPMQGDEFTQRLLTPFEEQKLTLLLRQGYDVDALLRLLGAEVHLDRKGTELPGVHRNRPADLEGYRNFRRVVSHLSAIQDRHALYVEPLHFLHTWTVPADAVSVEAFQNTYKEFSLTFDPEHRSYRVTKRVNGRVMISNYDPSVLSEEERRALHERAEDAPFNDVLIDIRADHIGGGLPLHGRLRLRSFHEILTFVGRAIEEERELDVTPDPRSPTVSENPVTTLEVIEAQQPPPGTAFSVVLNGRRYAIRPQDGYQWNRKAFSVLNQLFQMSVAPVASTGPSVSIVK